MNHRTVLFAAAFSFAASGCTFSAAGRVPVFARGHIALDAPIVVAAPAVAVQAAPVDGPEALCAVEAGPLWNNDHAQRECPGVCQRVGAIRQTGQWWTTRWNEMSVCQCAFPAGAACAAVDDRPSDPR